MFKLFVLRQNLRLQVVLLSLLHGAVTYSVAPTSSVTSPTDSTTAPSESSSDSASISASVSSVSRCLSDDRRWEYPCGVVRTRSIADSDISTDLLGIQQYINTSINEYTTVMGYLYTFVANVDFISQCGLNNVPERTLKIKLQSLITFLYDSLCACAVAEREFGVDYIPARREATLSPKIVEWAKTEQDELNQIEVVYYIVSDIETIVGLMKPWFEG